MELILFIFLGLIAFICLGVLGWIFKLLGYVFEFALDGCMEGIGCIFWVILVIVVLIGLAI